MGDNRIRFGDVVEQTEEDIDKILEGEDVDEDLLFGNSGPLK